MAACRVRRGGQKHALLSAWGCNCWLLVVVVWNELYKAHNKSRRQRNGPAAKIDLLSMASRASKQLLAVCLSLPISCDFLLKFTSTSALLFSTMASSSPPSSSHHLLLTQIDPRGSHFKIIAKVSSVVVGLIKQWHSDSERYMFYKRHRETGGDFERIPFLSEPVVVGSNIWRVSS